MYCGRSIITQSKIDDEVAKNEFRANREYYNKFDVTGGANSITSLNTLEKNSISYLPISANEDHTREYVITWDPSTKLDNSFVLVGEIFKDPTRGYLLKLVYGRTFKKKEGTTWVAFQKDRQIEEVQKLILDFNGANPEYNNIKRVIIDAGAGGGGFTDAQYMLHDWTDRNGQVHPGIIDRNDKYIKPIAHNFEKAIDILTLANFTGTKVQMYENTQSAINQGLVIFPKNINSRNEVEFERVKPDGEIELYYAKPNVKEMMNLIELEMLKYELMAMEKVKSATGRVAFETMPSKRSEGVKDDRADACAMMCNYLMQLRAQDKIDQMAPQKTDYNEMFKQRTGNIKQTNKPFSANNNPFVYKGRNNPFI